MHIEANTFVYAKINTDYTKSIKKHIALYIQKEINYEGKDQINMCR